MQPLNEARVQVDGYKQGLSEHSQGQSSKKAMGWCNAQQEGRFPYCLLGPSTYMQRHKQ